MKKNRPPLTVGDRVRLTGAFLRSTGQYAGSEGTSVWTVLGVEPDTFRGPGMITVDQVRAELGYWTPEELASDPTLKYRRILSVNLERVKGGH